MTDSPKLFGLPLTDGSLLLLAESLDPLTNLHYLHLYDYPGMPWVITDEDRKRLVPLRLEDLEVSDGD